MSFFVDNKQQLVCLFLAHHLGYSPLVHKGSNEGLHVFVQLLKHVWLSKVNGGSVIHIQTVGYCIVAA